MERIQPFNQNFTWFRLNPNKAARLDFFLITTSILNTLSDSYIMMKYRSDHCKIGLNLIQDKSERLNKIFLNKENNNFVSKKGIKNCK